jgi:hypothetical protein
MPETLKDKTEQASQGSGPSEVPLETIFHGTSVEAAKNILAEGFKPAPYARRPELGPVGWFNTESLPAMGYGQETRVRDANGMVTIGPNSGNSSPKASSYNVVIEAEAPKSSDPRGFNTFENGIEYLGTTRLVTELGMSNVAMKVMRLYEHKPTADGMPSTSGRLIDEHRFEPNPSMLARIRSKVRRQKNKMIGHPTL